MTNGISYCKVGLLITFLLTSSMLIGDARAGKYSKKTPFNVPEDVVLAPGEFGRSILPRVLKPGDIITSTTDKWLSTMLRLKTGSPVSHTILYIGNGEVIEVEGKVRRRTLVESLADASLAVAYRYPNLADGDAQGIVDYANSKLGKQMNVLGLLRHPRFGVIAEHCNSLPTPQLRVACAGWNAMVIVAADIYTNRNVLLVNKDDVFCSQLIQDAYQNASIDLFMTTSEKTSPGDIPILSMVGKLQYVGHIKTMPRER